MPEFTVNDIDLSRLQQVAQAMSRCMPGKLVIGLVGTLGAGKTTFVQALAAAVGIDPGDVTSPTFTLLSSHVGRAEAGKICLHHLDAYRVADEDEFLELGVDELFDAADSWVVIEWADRVRAVMPDETLWMRIETTAAPDVAAPRRSITFQTKEQAMLRRVQSAVEPLRW